MAEKKDKTNGLNKKKDSCAFTPGINCKEKDTCYSCGWNPNNGVCESRLERKCYIKRKSKNEKNRFDRLAEWESHNGCNTNCLFYNRDSNEYPCVKCMGNATRTDMLKFDDLYASLVTNTDAVNHPSHYTQGRIECIDAMESAFGAEELAAYCKIAAFKYIWRMENKGGIEDIKKAIWYLNKYVELNERLI